MLVEPSQLRRVPGPKRQIFQVRWYGMRGRNMTNGRSVMNARVRRSVRDLLVSFPGRCGTWYFTIIVSHHGFSSQSSPQDRTSASSKRRWVKELIRLRDRVALAKEATNQINQEARKFRLVQRIILSDRIATAKKPSRIPAPCIPEQLYVSGDCCLNHQRTWRCLIQSRPWSTRVPQRVQGCSKSKSSIEASHGSACRNASSRAAFNASR